MLGVMVQGGTGAGRRKVKPLPLWACRCSVVTVIGGRTVETLQLHPGERYSCSDCGARRPS